jgi:hypothetical protein
MADRVRMVGNAHDNCLRRDVAIKVPHNQFTERFPRVILNWQSLLK